MGTWSTEPADAAASHLQRELGARPIGSTLAQIAPEWFEDTPAPDDLNEDDVDLNDIVIGAGFTLLRLTGQIGAADRALVLRALDIRDRTYGRHPETRQMRTDLLAFGRSR